MGLMNWTERFSQAKKYAPAALGAAGLVAESVLAPVLGKIMFVDRSPEPLPAPVPQVDTRFRAMCDYRPGLGRLVPTANLVIENLLSVYGPSNEVFIFLGTSSLDGVEKQRMSLVEKRLVSDYIPLYWNQSARIVGEHSTIQLNSGEVIEATIKIGPPAKFGIGPVEDVDIKTDVIPGCTASIAGTSLQNSIVRGLLLP